MDKKESHLSITVAPSEVRLHPVQTDRYRWQCKDSKNYLFANQLSKLSTNAYIEIRMALAMGDIWAVRQDKLDNNTTEDGLHSKAFLPPSQTDNTDAVERSFRESYKIQGPARQNCRSKISSWKISSIFERRKPKISARCYPKLRNKSS